MNPGACKDGTSLTAPFIIPYASSSFTDHVPIDTPPYIKVMEYLIGNTYIEKNYILIAPKTSN